MIDLNLLEDLINGEQEPDSQGEVAFLNFYQRAVSGDSLLNIILDNAQEVDYYGIDEYELMVLGYAMGQKDFLDRIDGLELERIKKNDDEPLH